MDYLLVKDLEIYANHGVFQSEKELGQKFLVTLRMGYNMKKGATSNNLEDSIHYGILSKEVYDYFRSESIDLIETVAYKLVEFIFEKYKIVQEISVEIKKPWAPINLPLDTVKVTINRKKRRYFLGIGSNIGNKQEYVDSAIDTLKSIKSIELKRVSEMYITKAWGKTDQEDFLNCAVEIESYEEPEDLLNITQKIEQDLGRERHEKWGPRTIDIDILFCDGEIIYTDDLKIPHPYVQDRKFVLEPLNDFAEFFIHPVFHKTLKQLLEELESK
ncbi:MAG: 2-amino-4-hydroxy-6-hydroxymethyldihydropteridine diphosphokinase [Finegoldia magna]|uniref:2-amino-4-hydroxy-6- hydroxymethyldihydropteridine diphosphokinase n=1 Tax=Finegoldia magna TaxID=1260 RepID=UPI002914820A|nr:2-amino-4-hydroxy-6-hydroxymethyldihydropteridine diphosphokinase [Finegoldia magna]MDU7140281.1 2-amino-4-hydroxy-6-hydroxymethyldihydropteridine diphosphokinase [Finegoldia magna]